MGSEPSFKALSSQHSVALISALGTDQFETAALHVLGAIAGVEHYSIYRVRSGLPEFLGGASVRGQHPARLTAPNQRYSRNYAEQPGSPAMLWQHPVDDTEDPGLAGALRHYNIVDRILLCGWADNDLFAITLMRSADAGKFAADEIEALRACGEPMIAACAKHASIHWDRPRGVKIFASVDVIEATLREANWGLSVRELQVSARILFGISALGISIDLGLGEDTIATYRKRLYARLSIGSRHELMQKYLSLF
jgi:DNA-binding CsgD family transcriptional regulator